MNKKDIALSVAGVIATMALAYLFYRLQQKQSAASDKAIADQSQASYQQSADQYALLSTLSQVGNGTVASDTTSATNTSVDATAATNTGASSEADSLISSVLQEFLPASNNGITMPVDQQTQVLTGIPLSAGAALDGAAVTTITSSANGSTTTTTGGAGATSTTSTGASGNRIAAPVITTIGQ